MIAPLTCSGLDASFFGVTEDSNPHLGFLKSYDQVG